MTREVEQITGMVETIRLKGEKLLERAKSFYEEHLAPDTCFGANVQVAAGLLQLVAAGGAAYSAVTVPGVQPYAVPGALAGAETGSTTLIGGLDQVVKKCHR
jgi:fructose-specific phosphotransferase system IIC component